MSPIERGRLIPHFSLPNSHDKKINTWDYRGRFNLILLLTGGSASPAMARLIEDLSKATEDLLAQEAHVLVILPDDSPELDRFVREESLLLDVLLDTNSKVHHSFDVCDHSVACSTDRWGEINAVWPSEEHQALPTAPEMIKELDFINRQCPECFPPEWPI